MYFFAGCVRKPARLTPLWETHVLEYHGERRGDLYYTKEMLLAVGDKYEKEIAAARVAEAPYR